jgi:hypothetical protein
LNALLEPKKDRVAAELIDGEAIIINVATGTYYSTEGIGGWVWERCSAGQSLAEIVSVGCGRFEVSAEQLERDLLAFADTLKAEDLVFETPAQPFANHREEMLPAEKATYVAPTLLIYRDLKDLLALDPPMPRLDVDAKHGV